MPTITMIGDVHGHYHQYKGIITGRENTVQVGDMGVGFRHYGGPRDGEFSGNPPHYAMERGGHRFIRGNHDNPGVCRRHSQWIADGLVENGVMFIGGGLSIDQEYRVEGYSWWADEELSVADPERLVDVYATTRPETMVTHECPEQVAELLAAVRPGKLQFPSRTRQAFQSMFEIHQPKKWVFGHWHRSLDKVIDGTRFICLAELEYREIEV
jgi:hypothetical protein